MTLFFPTQQLQKNWTQDLYGKTEILIQTVLLVRSKIFSLYGI